MIGIIGGNGVAATNKLNCLIEECITKNGAFRDAHHPEIIIWQATKVPSRSMYLEGRGPSWIEDYIKIGLNLKMCGCTELCMCCNTAHYAIDELEKKIGVKFINLLDLVAIKCKKLGVKRVGMMCTEGLRTVGLYDKYFASLAQNVELVYPDYKFQKMVTTAICNAKNKIRFSDPRSEALHPYNCILNVCRHLYNEKMVECVVAGCTDISNVYCPPNGDLLYVDSLRVLAEYIVDRHLYDIDKWI